MVRIVWGALVMGAMLSAGCDQNKFMSKPPSHPNEYKWVAIIQKQDGTTSECEATHRRVTMKIKDNLLTIWPYYGYQQLMYSADLSKLNPDGSGSAFLEKDAVWESADTGMVGHITFDPGTGPRHMKLTSRYVDYCKYSIDPE
jgi:hypothetical protein